MGDYRTLNDDYEPPKRAGCLSRKVCCKKLTVWQLLLTILFVLVSMALVAYFVLVPHYIQKIINRTDLSFVSVMMRNITNSTVTIYAQSVISASPFTASIFPAKNFSISYQNIHMGYMDLPQITSKGGQPTNLYISDTIITISNSSHFIQYASDLLNTAQANWNMEGHVDVSVWKFTFHKFKFSKSVSITGMNGLAGTTVDSFSLPGDGPGHLKVAISSSIFNPSFVCMQIGDMSFDVIFENNTIGSVTAPNVTLLNGTNHYTMTGVIQPTDASGLQAVNNFVNQYVSGVPSSVSVRGTGGSPSSPPWLNTVLQSLQMTTQIEGIQNLTMISELSLNEISMALPGEAGDTTDSGLVAMSSFVISEYQSPFPALTFTFNSITIQSNMTDETGAVFGTFPSDTYAVFNQSKTHLGFQMTDAELRIVDRPLFMELVEQLLLTPSATFTLTGVANANITTRIGNLVLENVSLTQVIDLKGVNGFADYAIKIMTPNNHIVAGYDWGFELYLDTSILNPSSAAIQFSRLSFDIFYFGAFIGNGTSGNVSMAIGENRVIVQGKYIQPENMDLQREFMSNYLQGNDSVIQLVGNSENIPLVIPAVSKLNVSVIFPGNEQSLLAWAQLHLPPAGELALFNPIDCVVSISSLSNFQIYKTDWHYFTTAYDTTFDPPFEILPEQINITEPLKMKLTLAEFFSIFEGYLFGNHTLLATGVVEVSIQNFGPIVIDAQQNFTMVGL
eukprot:Phypoly_transcript_03934.p1 GENE.Phypoly_transcript_03934~~Phypoly_transcript_03934.p1  ORF type:complete len:732 (+),score=110.71 Phypoly_transcript_03934:98-2293(+)